MWGCILEVQRLDAPSADGALSHVESGTGHDEISCQSTFINSCLRLQPQCQQVHSDSCVPLLPTDGHVGDKIISGVVPAVGIRQRQFDFPDAEMQHACSLSTGD